jgi:transmembrane sensor
VSDDFDALASRRINAQAAVWVTDLHGPDRNAEVEEGVRRWIAADPAHAAAFEAATEAWQSSGNLPEPTVLRALSRNYRTFNSPTRPVLAGIAVLGLALAITLYLLKDDTLSTGPGEQKTVDLADGTQVILNANSRVRVRYDEHTRKIILVRGEALFNVAKYQPAPFVVQIGTHKVIAVGTSFEVRREDSSASSYSVTLVEGRVAIEPTSWSNELPATATAGLILLNPGERLRISQDAADLLDQPALDKVTAWQRGRLIFDDASLREAAAEFNRYGKVKLTIDPNVPATLRVGGVFKISDPATFARAMANVYHLRIVNRGQDITLSAQ